MKKKIISIAPWQTGKTFAVVYFFAAAWHHVGGVEITVENGTDA